MQPLSNGGNVSKKTEAACGFFATIRGVPVMPVAFRTRHRDTSIDALVERAAFIPRRMALRSAIVRIRFRGTRLTLHTNRRGLRFNRQRKTTTFDSTATAGPPLRGSTTPLIPTPSHPHRFPSLSLPWGFPPQTSPDLHSAHVRPPTAAAGREYTATVHASQGQDRD
jgi:hypothetical protein